MQSQSSLEFLTPDNFYKQPFTTADYARHEKIRPRTAREHLQTLRDLGEVRVVSVEMTPHGPLVYYKFTGSTNYYDFTHNCRDGYRHAYHRD